MSDGLEIKHIGNTGSNLQHKVYSVCAKGMPEYTVVPGLREATYMKERPLPDGEFERFTVHCNDLKTALLINLIPCE